MIDRQIAEQQIVIIWIEKTIDNMLATSLPHFNHLKLKN
jgi:hypothetical protein